MKGFHPNLQRDGYNLAGLLWIVVIIKYRRQIIAYTFRNYTRQCIRQLLSYLFNDNKSSYQENMLLCKRVLAVGFLTWVITSHTSGEIFGYTEFAFDFHWWWNYNSADLFPFPPLDFRVEVNGFMYCPTACTYSSKLVRGKQRVYISGESANWNYPLQNSNIHVLRLWNTPHNLGLVLEINL